jgi:phage gp46-like protein
MSDLGLTWSNDALAADVAIESNDLKPDDGLRTAVVLSLFTDRRADPGDELPEGETDRRGWWADAVAEVEGDRIGSRLWLLRRAKPVPETLVRAENYTREALQWLLDDKVASAVDVFTEFLTAPTRALSLEITIHRPSVDPVTFRFGLTWDAEAALS